MKKKKTEKKANAVSSASQPARKTGMKTAGPVTGTSLPVLAGISRSVGNLVDRTKAYLGSGKKAEA